MTRKPLKRCLRRWRRTTSLSESPEEHNLTLNNDLLQQARNRIKELS